MIYLRSFPYSLQHPLNDGQPSQRARYKQFRAHCEGSKAPQTKSIFMTTKIKGDIQIYEQSKKKKVRKFSKQKTERNLLNVTVGIPVANKICHSMCENLPKRHHPLRSLAGVPVIIYDHHNLVRPLPSTVTSRPKHPLSLSFSLSLSVLHPRCTDTLAGSETSCRRSNSRLGLADL